MNMNDAVRLIQAYLAEQRWIKKHHLRWAALLVGVATLIVVWRFRLV